MKKKLNINLGLIDNNESFLNPVKQHKSDKQLKEDMHNLAAMIGGFTSRDNHCKIKKKIEATIEGSARMYPLPYILITQN